MRTITETEILESAQTNNVRYVRLQFTDLSGVLKNVEIPVHQLKKALRGEVMFDGSSVDGFVRIDESDMLLRPDMNTWLIFPWTPAHGKVARLICDVHLPDGTPFAGDPRAILKNAIQEAKALGFNTANIGFESEFFLFQLDASGKPTETPNDHGGYFDIAPVDTGENCRRDIVLSLQEMGFSVASSHHEMSPGQHEIDFAYADALSAADNMVTFKMIVKTISRTHGLHATFMPKPLQYAAGSGFHCHQSLWYNNTENAFYDPTNPIGISDVARSYIAGLLLHAPAITAITNPLINSYKRLTSGYEAPTFVAWSTQNPMPFVRVPSARQASTRVELRSPDPACNPYLAFSVILKAGLHGISERLVPPTPIRTNMARMSEEERLMHRIRRLPTSLELALEALQEDEIIRNALGEHAFTQYLDIKTMEWEQYQATVHPWEISQYLGQY